MNKVKSKVSIFLFIIIIGMPYIIWFFVAGEYTGSNKENRNWEEKPTFSIKTIETFPSQYEAYLNDHLPFRDKMIQLYSAFSYYVLHSSINSDVVIGKDGWLFYNRENAFDFYNGRKVYSEENLKKLADNLQKTKDHLEEKGIVFVLFIAPNKERVYPEFMPGFYGDIKDDTALTQVIDYLHENTDVTIVYPYDSLMTAKQENQDRLLYHKTDTHWNDLGAYIGTRDLFSSLGIPWDEGGISYEEIDDNSGDLADMLNLSDIIEAGKAYKVTGYMGEDTELLEKVFVGTIRYSTPSKDTGTILMCRDSFCTAMAPVIGSAFTDSYLVHRRVFETSMIDEIQPDYFVYQILERSLDDLFKFSY